MMAPAVDDDLRRGQELRAEQKVEHRQRSHHHNQRKGAVDGMGLQQEIDGSGQAESGKNDKQNQVHRSVHLRGECRLPCSGRLKQKP